MPAPFARFRPGLVLHVPILMYHRIVPPTQAGDSLPDLVMPPGQFAAQMATLRTAGWHAITAATLAEDLATGRSPAPRSFVPTFDDGWSDGYTYAFPILRELGFVGTFYVITGRIGQLGNLSGTQMQAMAAGGMEMGDHTVSHADLPAKTPAVARFEIDGGVRQIEAVLGVRPVTFAYPYGGTSVRDQALVAQGGLDLAVTTVEGCLETAANQFAAPRMRVGPGMSPADLLASMEYCQRLDR